MTTSGVQVAGMRSAKAVSVGARAGNRAAGGTSFADMMSVGASAQKGSSAAPARTEPAKTQRAQTTNSQEPAKNVQETAQTPDTAQNTKENPKLPGNETAQDVKNGNVQGDAPQEDQMVAGDLTSEDSGENAGLDTEFVKSLKLFREASKILETQKLGELKQAIMDSMQIDEEELEQLLEQLGTNMQGLLQPQLLQQLVVAAECNGDPMKLLTNESAMNDLKILLAKAEEIRTDLQENQATLKMPEGVSADAFSASQGADVETDTPDFAQILAQVENPNKEVSKTAEENIGKDMGKDGMDAKVTGAEKNAFSFEAVRESGQSADTKGRFADSQGSKSDTRADATTMTDQFLNLVTDAAKTDEAEFAQLSRSEQVRAVAEQILEKVRVVLSDKQTSMEISLTPESLGRVTLNLVSRHGALTAHFTAQNEVAKEAIQSQMVVLRENLESQGLKVEAIEVTVSNFDFTQNGGAAANNGNQENRQRGRRGIRFDETVNADGSIPQGMSEAEQIAADLMERSGNQVDYTA